MLAALRAQAREIYAEARQPVFIRQMVWVLVFAVFMVIVLYLNIQFLTERYPNPPQPPDLLLDRIPQNDIYIAIGELASSVQMLLIFAILFSAPERFRHLPRLGFYLIFMFILRSFAITLTPLGQIEPPSQNYAEGHFIAQTFYHGMFFSGHTASALIQVMFFREFFLQNKRIGRWTVHKIRISHLLWPLALVQIGALLGSHQHYTIDIFGAIFVAYFVTHCDWMAIVPPALREVRWMPWYGIESVQSNNHNGHLPTLATSSGQVPELYTNGNGQHTEREYEREPDYEPVP